MLTADSNATKGGVRRPALFCGEDWWSIWLGWAVLLVAVGATWLSRPADHTQRVAQFQALTQQLDELEKNATEASPQLDELRERRDAVQSELAINPLTPWLANLSAWDDNPLTAFRAKNGESILPGILGVLVACLVLFGIGLAGMGESARGFPIAFLAIFALAMLAFVLAGQNVVKHYNLEYAL